LVNRWREKFFVGEVRMKKTSLFGLVGLAFVVLIVAMIAQSYGLLPNFKAGGLSGSGGSGYNPINLGANGTSFTGWELKTWIGIKDRLEVINTDPDFPDPSHRVLEWWSVRNSSSNDYYQKSMEWMCFWTGQGANGEWEAVVSIYNRPNDTGHFVVEVARFSWHSLNVTLDDSPIVSFPQVSANVASVGYMTFDVTPL
jgi:hypothetical protein